MRIRGVLINKDKSVWAGLTQIFGIGKNTAMTILKEMQINYDKKVRDITQSEEDKIREFIEKRLKTEGDLRLEISRNIKRLKEISSYRGDRHSRNLPARGQRTKTNARTKRGKKVTIGSGRKKSLEKT